MLTEGEFRIPTHAQGRFQVQTASSQTQACAVNVRVDKLGLGMHDRRIRIDTTIIRILKQTIYNTLISIIYIKMISMTFRTY